MTLRDSFNQHDGRLVGKIEHFFDVYEPHFSRFRNTPLRLLEIGIDKGGSLELWRNYFGPQAELHGIDINPKTRQWAPDDAVVHIGSQSDAEFLRNVGEEFGPFDIIIDDGSHRMPDQIQSFDVLYPYVSEQGFYVCEDSFTSYWQEFGGATGAPDTFIEYAKKLLDELHAYWAIDDHAAPTEFTCSTRGIYFYSGTTVFERAPVKKPLYVLRSKAGLNEVSIESLKDAAAANLKTRESNA